MGVYRIYDYTGLLKSIALQWKAWSPLQSLVPVERVFTGKIPTPQEYPMPYVSVVESTGKLAFRTDKSLHYHVPVSFHIYVDDSRLHLGEKIERAIIDAIGNRCWSYEDGWVLDVLDAGPGTKIQEDAPNYNAWQIIHLVTLSIEMPRRASSDCCAGSGSSGSEDVGSTASSLS